MGRYLNSKKPGLLFWEDVSSTYFVDKSGILNHLITLAESGENVKNKGKMKRNWRQWSDWHIWKQGILTGWNGRTRQVSVM